MHYTQRKKIPQSTRVHSPSKSWLMRVPSLLSTTNSSTPRTRYITLRGEPYTSDAEDLSRYTNALCCARRTISSYRQPPKVAFRNILRTAQVSGATAGCCDPRRTIIRSARTDACGAPGRAVYLYRSWDMSARAHITRATDRSCGGGCARREVCASAPEGCSMLRGKFRLYRMGVSVDTLFFYGDGRKVDTNAIR